MNPRSSGTLALRGLTVHKGSFVLSDITLETAPGEYLVITGPNGSGKTTLLEAVAGLVPVQEGAVLLDGEAVTHRPPESRGMGVVFQDGALFPHLTVAENVAFGLRMRRWDAAAIARRVDEVSEAVSIRAWLDRAPSTLSGGEQRRVAIARALAPSPEVLLLDEPLAGVDATGTEELLELLTKLHRTLGLTVLHVAHQSQEIHAVAERVIRLDHGRLAEVEVRKGRPPLATAQDPLPPSSSVPAQRYARQLTLPGWNREAQARLRNATVFVTRVGGLGGPLAQQLVLAGVGKLILVHGGLLDEEDMNRMVLMDAAQIGQPRLPQAVASLKRLNPAVTIQAVPVHLASLEHAKTLLEGVTVAVSATPSFEERFLVNRAAVEMGIPVVESSMDGWTGTLTTIVPGRTACLACRTPEAPPDWNPVGFPVLAATSAAMGSLAAHETLRVAAGLPPVLAGRLMVVDAETMTTRHFTLRRDPACPHCGAPVLKRTPRNTR